MELNKEILKGHIDTLILAILEKKDSYGFEIAKNVLEQTPPELSADIMNKGIVLTGGGALLHGLDRLLADELHVPVFVADNPLHCVVIGTGIMLDHIDKIRRR